MRGLLIVYNNVSNDVRIISMLHSTEIDQLSVINLNEQNIKPNSDDYYGACYGQALLVNTTAKLMRV